MQLFTETQVGKAMPFFNSFSFLNTLLVSSSIKESPKTQISRTELPAVHFSMTFFKIPAEKQQKCIKQNQIFHTQAAQIRLISVFLSKIIKKYSFLVKIMWFFWLAPYGNTASFSIEDSYEFLLLVYANRYFKGFITHYLLFLQPFYTS